MMQRAHAASRVNSALVQKEAKHKLLLYRGLCFILAVSLFHTFQQMITYV